MTLINDTLSLDMILNNKTVYAVLRVFSFHQLRLYAFAAKHCKMANTASTGKNQSITAVAMCSYISASKPNIVAVVVVAARTCDCLVAQSNQRLGGGLEHVLLGSSSTGAEALECLDAFVVSLAAHLALVLELLDNLLVFPADLASETRQGAVLATWLQANDTQSSWDDNALDSVIWRWDTFEHLKTVQSGSTTGSLVWDHTADGTEEDAGWSAEMEWTTFRVDNATLAQESVILELVAEERSRHLDILAAHKNDALAAQDLLGDSAGQTTEQMALGINDDHLFESGHG